MPSSAPAPSVTRSSVGPETKISAEKQFNKIYLKLSDTVTKLVMDFLNKVNTQPQKIGFWPKFRQAVKNFWHGNQQPNESVDLDSYLAISEQVNNWVEIVCEYLDYNSPNFAGAKQELLKGLRVAARNAVTDVAKVTKTLNVTKPEVSAPSPAPAAPPEPTGPVDTKSQFSSFLKKDLDKWKSSETTPTAPVGRSNLSSFLKNDLDKWRSTPEPAAEPTSTPVAAPAEPTKPAPKKRGRPKKVVADTPKPKPEPVKKPRKKAERKSVAKSQSKDVASTPAISSDDIWSNPEDLQHMPTFPESNEPCDAFFRFNEFYDNLNAYQKKRLKESLIKSLTLESKTTYYKLLMS